MKNNPPSHKIILNLIEKPIDFSQTDEHGMNALKNSLKNKYPSNKKLLKSIKKETDFSQTDLNVFMYSTKYNCSDNIYVNKMNFCKSNLIFAICFKCPNEIILKTIEKTKDFSQTDLVDCNALIYSILYNCPEEIILKTKDISNALAYSIASKCSNKVILKLIEKTPDLVINDTITLDMYYEIIGEIYVKNEKIYYNNVYIL